MWRMDGFCWHVAPPLTSTERLRAQRAPAAYVLSPSFAIEVAYQTRREPGGACIQPFVV
jgi:hypothetical protein